MNRIGNNACRVLFRESPMQIAPRQTIRFMTTSNNPSSNSFRASPVSKFYNGKTIACFLGGGCLLSIYLFFKDDKEHKYTTRIPPEPASFKPRSEITGQEEAALQDPKCALGTLFRSAINIPNISQSDSHFNENVKDMLHYHEPELSKHPQIVPILLKALENERMVCKQSLSSNNDRRYVMYHGQSWKTFWFESLYTMLWELKYHTQTKDYIFTRFPRDANCMTHANDQYIGSNKRKEQLMGINPEYAEKTFCTSALFCNYGEYNAAYYVINNTSCYYNPTTARKIFERFGLELYYDQNKEEIDLLESEFMNLTSYGNLLQIIIPENHLTKHFIPADFKGRKTFDLFIGHKTSDMVKIIDIMIREPARMNKSGYNIYCWLVTSDTLYRAIEDDVKIRSYNTANPQELERVKSKLCTTLAKIQFDTIHECDSPRQCYKSSKKFFKFERFLFEHL